MNFRGFPRGERNLGLDRELGAEAMVNYSKPDWSERVREVTVGAGPDVVFDGVGGRIGQAAFEVTAHGGRFSAHIAVEACGGRKPCCLSDGDAHERHRATSGRHTMLVPIRGIFQNTEEIRMAEKIEEILELWFGGEGEPGFVELGYG